MAIFISLLVFRFFTPWTMALSAEAWFAADTKTQQSLADYLVDFESSDDESRAKKSGNRFSGEWALVTHQMVVLGLGQVVLAHPELKKRYLPTISRAAQKCFLPEMRSFGSRAWHGEDAMESLAGDHGHAYMGYAALAVGMARYVGAPLPQKLTESHDRLIRAFIRRLAKAPYGLIETYPHEAYPTDVAACAGAIALHARVTAKDHSAVLAHWKKAVRRYQIHQPSGYVYQRMDARTGKPKDAPRGSGTALGAYFAGFADRGIREQLAKSVMDHVVTFSGFGAVREYAKGFSGKGDVDSGPVLFGVSVAATGFALALARDPAHRESFDALLTTAMMFGVPASVKGHIVFSTGGPIGNALLLAMLSSGPELAP